MSQQLQGMRLEAERNISTSVDTANTQLKAIADLNNQIAQRRATNVSVADLQDQRDVAIDKLSTLMDIKRCSATTVQWRCSLAAVSFCWISSRSI